MDTVEPLHVHDCAAYRITVQGVLDERWSDWLDGMRIASTTGAGAADPTVPAGQMDDQRGRVSVVGEVWCAQTVYRDEGLAGGAYCVRHSVRW